MTITIRILETSNGTTRASSHRTSNVNEAVNRAIAKHYGAKCGLYRDSGLPFTDRTRYGQIGYYLPEAGASTMVTGRVRIDIEQ